MNKSLKTLLFPILFFTFLCFSNVNEASALTSSEVKEGDILVTNQTQCILTTCAKIAGHAGIVVNANGGLKVLHIPGKTSGLEQVKLDSVSTFFSNYNQKIKVVRANSSTTASKAAKQALTNFANLSSGKYTGKKIEYLISTGVTDISKTYCSEIVWYSYYKAGLTFKVFHAGALISWKDPSIISPYDFTDRTQAEYNKFTIVDNTY